MSKITFN